MHRKIDWSGATYKTAYAFLALDKFWKSREVLIDAQFGIYGQNSQMEPFAWQGDAEGFDQITASLFSWMKMFQTYCAPAGVIIGAKDNKELMLPDGYSIEVLNTLITKPKPDLRWIVSPKGKRFTDFVLEQKK